MSARAKLRCWRRLSRPLVSFQSPSFVLQHYRTLYEKTIKYTQWRISGKPSSSLALVANERISPNDGHAQRKSQDSLPLACGATVSRRIWRLPGAANHTRCVFSITTQLLAKGFKQNLPNWKSFRLLSILQNWRSTVLA